jgi:serine/threonine protein kinase
VPRADGDKFIGTTLPAGYHILELIGVGGMGRVYQAEQSVLGRTVAVKIIHPHLLSDENSAVRFLTEARAASQLNHPTPPSHTSVTMSDVAAKRTRSISRGQNGHRTRGRTPCSACPRGNRDSISEASARSSKSLAQARAG